MTNIESAMMRLLTAIESRIACIEKDVRWLRQRVEATAVEQRITLSEATADSVRQHDDSVRQHDKVIDAILHPPGESS